MAAGDFYEVVVRGQIAASQIRNVFWYHQLTGVEGAEQLAPNIETQIIEKLRAVTSTATQFTGYSVRNHNDAIDFYDENFSPVRAGLRTGDRTPTMLAIAFRTLRRRTDMRHGFKRVGGIAENDLFGDSFSAALGILLDDLAAEFSSDQASVGVASTWNPVIVRREAYTTESGKTAYRVPAVIGASDFYLADRWEKQILLTTQNTRKAGRGI